MSDARGGTNPVAQAAAAQHVVRLLKDAQAVIDRWNVPQIGARLQEVIEAIEEAALR